MAYVVTFDDVPVVETGEPHHRALRVLLSPILHSSVRGIAVGCTEVPPNQSTNPHTHTESDEIWVVAAGDGRIVVGDLTTDVAENTVVHIPKGAEHSIENTGSSTLRVYWIFQPDGPENAILGGLVT